MSEVRKYEETIPKKPSHRERYLMWSASPSKADEQLSAARKKFKEALREKEKIWRQRAEATAKLRNVRLAREAAEKAARPKNATRKSAKISKAEKK